MTLRSWTAVWTAASTICLVDLHQLGGVFHHAGLGKAAVSLTGQFLQRVQDGGPGPIRAVAVDSQLRRQFIGGLEADAPDVVGQLVRVRFDLGDDFVSVGAVDADGPPRRDAMLGQKEHDLADLLLLLPALANPLQPFLADAFDVQQKVGGLLEDFQGSLLVCTATILAASFGPMLRIAPEARYFSMPSAEAGWVVLSSSALNCWPMLSVDHPATTGLDMFPRRHRGRTADERHQVFSSFDLHSQDGETILRVVVGDSFDQSSQVFGHWHVVAVKPQWLIESSQFQWFDLHGNGNCGRPAFPSRWPLRSRRTCWRHLTPIDVSSTRFRW